MLKNMPFKARVCLHRVAHLINRVWYGRKNAICPATPKLKPIWFRAGMTAARLKVGRSQIRRAVMSGSISSHLMIETIKMLTMAPSLLRYLRRSGRHHKQGVVWRDNERRPSEISGKTRVLSARMHDIAAVPFQSWNVCSLIACFRHSRPVLIPPSCPFRTAAI
jgi:hypothetical protein